MEMPAVEVRFNGLSASRQIFIGSRSLPTLTNALLSMGEGMVAPLLGLMGVSRTKKKIVTMLENVSGVLKPVRFAALLMCKA